MIIILKQYIKILYHKCKTTVKLLGLQSFFVHLPLLIPVWWLKQRLLND